MTAYDPFSAKGINREPLTSFRGRYLPVPAYLAGYSALMQAFDLHVPLHHTMAAVAPRTTRRKEERWAVYPAPLRPSDTVVDHLVFALKYEGVQLLTLKKVFLAFDKAALEKAARNKPTSAYIRRLCFLYEWLVESPLAIPDVTGGAYVEAVDVKLQYGTYYHPNEARFRVRDNLPGSSLFCPLVFKTRRLDQFIEMDLAGKARSIVAGAPPELIARAAAFLLLSDSKASFAIEGENPPKDRIARWGAAISKAGQIKLNEARLVALQREIIGDDRFVTLGLRREGGFIGRHDSFGQPEPEHVSANAPDLRPLLAGLFAFDLRSGVLNMHPVLAAACMAFGFVYIHPFEDGNGRLHRFLMHHVLAETAFTPKGLVFPISSVILDDIARYKDVLETVSRPLLPFVDWTATERGNVVVRNDTADFYRYFDATAHCEYLFRCIERAVDKDLPEELALLESRDGFHRRVTEIVDMGERRLDLLLRFLRQNHGTFSKRARTEEFSLLTDQEAMDIESIYTKLFG